MKYAIVESGGKQYKAVEGSTIEVDLLTAEAGQQVKLDTVLLLVDGEQVAVGTPNITGAAVDTTVVGSLQRPQDRGFPLFAQEAHSQKARPPHAVHSLTRKIDRNGVGYGAQERRRLSPQWS